MEDVSTTGERSYAGASANPGATSGLHPALIHPQTSTAPADLPMIVWLRGDESYVDEFCIDAEAAMKSLGIKRSRLTQISGKELRVGRLRVDRYTRPVYRAEDIEAYKNWTRATASHQRASSAIEDAASRLENHSKLISEHLKSMFVDQVENLNDELVALKEEVRTQRQHFIDQSQHHIEQAQQRFVSFINNNYEELRLRHEALHSEMVAVRSQEQKLADALQQLQKNNESSQGINDLASLLTSRLDELQGQQQAISETIAQFTRDIGKGMAIVLQFQREAIKKSEEVNEQQQQLSSLIAQVQSQTPGEPQGAPRRKLAFALRRRMARRMY